MMRLALAAAAIAIVACTPAPAGLPPQGARVDGTSWRVVEVKRRATPASAADYFIRFNNSQLSARFGCNHMGGRYRQAATVIHAHDIASTLMGCPEPAATLERDASVILGQPMRLSWTSHDRLELSNRAGAIKLARIQ